MGFVILTIDRALIKGITKWNKRKLAPLLFRGLLALTIGTFMAQPALLFLFDQEIQLQVSLDNEQRKQSKRKELDNLYQQRKEALQAEKASIATSLNEQYKEVATARDQYLAETDGSGGSGKVGLKEIAKAKKDEYDQLNKAYQDEAGNQRLRINEIDKGLVQIEEGIRQQETAFLNYLNTGFLTRMQALNNLLKDNAALQFRYYLILIILMLIELMPVLVKTMLPAGVYDEKVQQQEELELLLAIEVAGHEKEMKRYYNKLSMQRDTETMDAFFRLQKEEQNQKITHWGKDWKAHDEPVQGFWEKIKRQMITRPEN
jgi:hypothetical protein